MPSEGKLVGSFPQARKRQLVHSWSKAILSSSPSLGGDFPCEYPLTASHGDPLTTGSENVLSSIPTTPVASV